MITNIQEFHGRRYRAGLSCTVGIFTGTMGIPSTSPTKEEIAKKASQISNATRDSTYREFAITPAAPIQGGTRRPVRTSPAQVNRARRKMSPTRLSKHTAGVLS